MKTSTFTRKIPHVSCVIGAFLLTSLPITADITLVDFGGDMVENSQQYQSAITTSQTEDDLNRDFNGNGTESGRVITRALDLTNPWLANSPPPDYSGPSFFGGVTIYNSSTTGDPFKIDAASVIDNAAGDYLRPVLRLGDSAATRASATLILFSVSNGQFQTGDSLTHAVGSDNAFNNTGRFVVRADGTFYVSENEETQSLGTIDPSAINWGLYTNPESNGIINGSDNLLLSGSPGTGSSLPTFNVAGSTLSNIDFIGYLGMNSMGTGGTASTAPSIGEFTYVAIPEPSTFIMMLSAMGLLFFLGRRKHCGN